ncbi:MAG: hypothetical protein ACI4MQ_04755 [Candidatus Coproplasma sp.]
MILTPVSLWKDFNSGRSSGVVSCENLIKDGIKYEYVTFYGRNTEEGRVLIYGVIASDETNPSKNCVLFLQDGGRAADENLLAYFVKKGYTAMFADYSGCREGVEKYTVYPKDVDYADWENCKYSLLTVNKTAEETCWYEWTAVGVYARQFLADKFATDSIGLIGIGDGGEIAWKLAYVAQFSCAICVNACGWLAYSGSSKFNALDRTLSDNDCKFIAGLDSQSYAPYVKCPVLLLCSTGEADFNYDRAYDTFSRINPQYALSSSIAYSLSSETCIDEKCERDMFLFLDSNVKKRYVFMPKPVEVNISTDDEENLFAYVKCDRSGIVEKCGAYISEDSIDYSTRNWSLAPLTAKDNAYDSKYALNVYEKTSTVFVIAYASYSSGFTVWSKVAVKKVSGRFRNSRSKSKILYCNNFGPESFSPENCSANSIGGLFLSGDEVMPHVINVCGLDGVYSVCGLKTQRIMSPQFMPDEESILKFDICSGEDTSVTVKLTTKFLREEYVATFNIIGGVWQSMIIEPKILKNKFGASLSSFVECESVSVNAEGKFALNNLMWL